MVSYRNKITSSSTRKRAQGEERRRWVWETQVWPWITWWMDILFAKPRKIVEAYLGGNVTVYFQICWVLLTLAWNDGEETQPGGFAFECAEHISRLHGGKDEFPSKSVLREQSPGQSSSKQWHQRGRRGTYPSGNGKVREVRGEIESDILENK